jgi:hypothetical protein
MESIQMMLPSMGLKPFNIICISLEDFPPYPKCDPVKMRLFIRLLKTQGNFPGRMRCDHEFFY